MYHPGLMEVARRDPRYAYEAYEFVFEALNHTQKMLGRPRRGDEGEPGPEHHVTGAELLLGEGDGVADELVRLVGVPRVFPQDVPDLGVHRSAP